MADQPRCARCQRWMHTASDIAKSDDALYRSLVAQAHDRRFDVGLTDSYAVVFTDAKLAASGSESD